MTREDAFHADVAGYLSWALAPPAAWSTFPAGGGGFNRGLRLKRLGLKAGWPDIILCRPLAGPGAGAFVGGLELKTDDGKLLPSQIDTHPQLIAAGWRIEVCRSLIDVKAALASWGFDLLTEKPSTTRLMAAGEAAFATLAPEVEGNGADPFTAHAAHNIRGGGGWGRSTSQRAAAPPASPPTGAEKAVKEKETLLRHYKRASRAERERLFAQEPRLKEFARKLTRFQRLEQADEFLVEARTEAVNWLQQADPDSRFLALSLISERIERIRSAAGLDPLEDPMPPEPGEEEISVFHICKKELAL